MPSSGCLLGGCGVLLGGLTGVEETELRALRAVRRDDGVDMSLRSSRL